jgi:hypothetical protein
VDPVNRRNRAGNPCEIEHAPFHVAGVRAVRDVRARWIGHRVYSDLAIEVDPKLSVGEADVLASDHKYLRLCDLCKELAFAARRAGR